MSTDHDHPVVAVLGGTSPVGRLAIQRLLDDGNRVIALSRAELPPSDHPHLTWASAAVSAEELLAAHGPIQRWIALSPIWILKDYHSLIAQTGGTRVVALSSTSRFTKVPSTDGHEADVVGQLVAGEESLVAWAEAAGIHWTVLRPTLIYGRGTDRNLSEIVRIIRRVRAFPVFGPAGGRRQPVYVDDVAAASVLAVDADRAANRAYNLSGAEVLSYREMVGRIFDALGMRRRVLAVPIWLFRLALLCLRTIPRYRNWNSQMIQRMSMDMVFDHQEAHHDFGFDPRPFSLGPEDLIPAGETS